MVDWHLRHGAEQILCLPPTEPLPTHVVISVPDAAARDGTLAVAASLLRHIPAEAIYLAIHPSDTPEQARSACLRDLLDVRTAALSRHGLDMRTETRFGGRHGTACANWPPTSARCWCSDLADLDALRLAAASPDCSKGRAATGTDRAPGSTDVGGGA